MTSSEVLNNVERKADMVAEKKYEASYAGFVYEKPVTYWTSSEDVKGRLKRLDLKRKRNIRAGGMPIISNGRVAYADTKDGHTAIIASSSMKKSICCFMPLAHVLSKAGENMILTDPKGELYDRMYDSLMKERYTVYCLDLRKMDKDCYNILYYPTALYRSGDKEAGLSLLSDIVNTLAEEQRKRAKDPFWPDTGAMWCNGTGALMMDAYPDIDQVNVVNWAEYNIRSSAAIVEEHIVPLLPNNMTKSSLNQCLSSAENTFRSILITASSFLSMFNQNPKLAAMLSCSTFTPEDLIKPKTALFLVTDDTTSTADPVLGIIIRQLQSFFINKAYINKNRKLEVRENFLLDEFASIPIPDMDKALATHRSRNIRYYLCIQSLAMLRNRYDEPEALLANCTSVLYLGSTELELLQQLETKLGKTYITPDGSERPLCSQSELMTLEKAWDYKEAIYMNLSENIRYCTKLPAIEAYGICNDVETSGIAKSMNDYKAINEVKRYSVARFAAEVVNGHIRAPFAQEAENEEAPGKRYKAKIVEV